MSEGVVEGAGGPEVVQLDLGSDSLGAFSALMDALAPEEESKTPAGDPGGAAPVGDAPVAGAPAAGQPPAGDGAEAGAVAGPAGDTAGGPAEPPVGAAEPAAGEPAAAGAQSTVDATTLIPQLGELSTKIETKVAEQHHAAALAEVRGEHEQYFKALEKHPRLLVGTQVPRANGEGMETLRDVKDAENWQEAIKSLLVEEVQSRAQAAVETQTAFLETVNNSVKLFQDNPDLIPGTKQFDKELGDRFAALAKPYETRVEGKLMGYAIPVQPLIDSLRATLVTERSAKAATPAPAAASPAAAGTGTPVVPPPPKPEDLPQEGISSKAGSGGGEKEDDFSTLFGTIGLPDFKI